MANTQYKTKILLRTDTTSNWETLNPTLKLGEMGFAIDAGVVIGGKVGMNKSWNSTPYHFTAFKPIVTNYGRNLDYPNQYNKTHNFQTETEAWEYVLYPYSAPSVSFGGGAIIWDSEVGDTFNNYDSGTFPYSFNIYNTPSLFIEGGKKVYYTSVNDTPATIAAGTGTKFELTDQVNNTVLQGHPAPLNANSNVTGTLNVFSAYVRGKKDPTNVNSVYGESAYVRFRIRSAAFLWAANNSLLSVVNHTDAQLSAIIRNIGQTGGVNGVRYTNMADGSGNKVFNGGSTIVWNTTTLDDMTPEPPAAVGHVGFFKIVIAAPISAGTPIMHNAAVGPESPMAMTTRDFMYSNGTATGVNAIPYRLYESNADITGTLSVKIV